MVVFELNNGHTTVIFLRNHNGKVVPFPSDNANLVISNGTKEAKLLFYKIMNMKEGE